MIILLTIYSHDLPYKYHQKPLVSHIVTQVTRDVWFLVQIAEIGMLGEVRHNSGFTSLVASVIIIILVGCISLYFFCR